MGCHDYNELSLPESGGSIAERIDRLVKGVLVRGELPGSPTSVLLGQYYHLGGLAATKILAEMAGFCANDTVLDVCCFVGGGARYLAQTTGCQVVGLDRDATIIALARQLAELAGLQDRVTFVLEDLYRADQLGQKFTGIWSEASLANSLDWLEVMDRAVLPGGKLAFSLYVRAAGNTSTEPPNSLQDVVEHLSAHGFDVLSCEDMREWEIEHGWKALLRQLDENESFYRETLGADWVCHAREQFQRELDTWSRTGGNAFLVARKA